MKKNRMIALSFAFIMMLNINTFAKGSTKAVTSKTTATEVDLTDKDIQTLTIEDAVNLAIKNSKNLKNVEENKSLSEDTKDDTVKDLKYASEYAQVTGLAVQLKNLNNKIANYDAATEIEKQSIELSIIELFSTIIEAERKLELYNQQISIEEKEIDIAKLKVELGLLSQNDYNTKLNSYNKTIVGKDKLQVSINEAYTSLNKILGVNLNEKYNLVLEVEYTPLGEVSLQTIINKALATNQSIKEKQDAVDIAKYEYDVFSSLYSGGTKEEKQVNYSQATRTLSDAKTNLEQSITNIYNSILTTENDYNTNITDLEFQKSQLELKELQFSLGKITELELEDYKYQISSLESDIQSQIYSHNVLVRKLNNTNLI